MAVGMRPLTVLVPENNMQLIRAAMFIDNQEKVSVYLRHLVNRDLREKGLLPRDADIVLHHVELDVSEITHGEETVINYRTTAKERLRT